MIKNVLLWKFRKNDNDPFHYIFGTMHVNTEAAFSQIDLIKKYIAQSEIYAAEMHLDQASDTHLDRYFKLKSGQKFSDNFRKHKYVKYRNVIKKTFNIDIAYFDDYTPFFISNLLAQSTLTTSDHEKALDHFLWTYAKENSKKMYGVESVDDQISYLKRIPLDYQLKAFKDIVKNVKAFKKKILHLDKLYEKGDLKRLYKLTKKSLGKIRIMMLYERNEKMAKSIIELASNGHSFIAVGAAHLSGNKGILKLLKQAGYKVQPVCQKSEIGINI